MRISVLIFALMSVVGCGGKNGSNGSPGLSVTSRWQYTTANGVASCSGGEYFGDGSQGCILKIRITKFNDGSAHIALIDGINQSFDYFAPVGSHTDDWPSSNLGGFYRFTVNASTTPPTFSANFDSNSNFNDTFPRAFTLTEL